MRTLTTISALLICLTGLSRPFAVVRMSSADMYGKGSFSSPVETQELMGTKVEILEENGKWIKIHSPQPYDAWITRMNLVFMNDAEAAAYDKAPKCICTALQSVVCSQPRSDSQRLCDLVMGDRMRMCGVDGEQNGQWMKILLPDSRTGWVKRSDVVSESSWKAACDRRSEEQIREFVIKTAESMLGCPYVWGGCTPKGTDCSGLTRMCYMMAGIDLPRNASQQLKKGQAVAYGKDSRGLWKLDELKKGDLLFFGSSKNGSLVISHVGIYLGDYKMIHCSQFLRIDSLVKGTQKCTYYADTHRLAGVRRIVGK